MRVEDKVAPVREYLRWRESTGAVGALDGHDLDAWEKELRLAALASTLQDVADLLAISQSDGQAAALERVDVARRTLMQAIEGLE